MATGFEGATPLLRNTTRVEFAVPVSSTNRFIERWLNVRSQRRSPTCSRKMSAGRPSISAQRE